MAYDEVRRRTVLFGGLIGTLPSGHGANDTWEWDGTTWTDVATPHAPPARFGHSLTWDAARGRIVLFGGSTDQRSLLADTWEYDGRDWTRRSSPTSPPARSGHGATFDTARGRVIAGAAGTATLRLTLPGRSDAALRGPGRPTDLLTGHGRPGGGPTLWIDEGG